MLLRLVGLALLAAGPGNAPPAPVARARGATEREARAFLETVTGLLQPVARVAAESAWLAATDVSPGHSGERAGAERAAAALLGARPIVARAKALLALERRLDPLTARQLRRLLLHAAESPATLAEVVARRNEAEARQSSVREGFSYCLDPESALPATPDAAPAERRCARPATASRLDEILRRSPDLEERARAWTASKQVGRPLRPGLERLVGLRNQVAREMGYPSFFAQEVADYDMTVPEMMALLDGALEATAPLYGALHCWARQTLASRWKQPAPRLLPAHWIGNGWAQTWPGLVEGTDLDPVFAGRGGEAIVRSAEAFFVALGFPRLPESFWQKSDLYPLASGAARRKSGQASAFHIDGEQDVRSLMNVEPTQPWWGGAHHELGHVYYYLAYARPEVPYLLRTGANRAFHEAIGELTRLASSSPRYLRRIGVLPAGAEMDATRSLLAAAMDSIVFLPFAAGTVTHFERDLYEGELPASEWQSRWWQYVERFQGVVPPSPRAAELCDACTKSQLDDQPARYYDYAIATLIKFQLHDHICRKILAQDVRDCDYGGNPAVGELLRSLLGAGATRDWRRLLRDTTGEAVGPRALLDFFAPLPAELGRRNQGLDCSR